MRSTLFLLLVPTLLLPPSMCICVAAPIQTVPSKPVTSAVPPKKKCGCCHADKPASEEKSPAKPEKPDHAPGCPVVRNLSVDKIVDVATTLIAPISVAILPVHDDAKPNGPISETPRISVSDGPPRHLLFQHFVI